MCCSRLRCARHRRWRARCSRALANEPAGDGALGKRKVGNRAARRATSRPVCRWPIAVSATIALHCSDSSYITCTAYTLQCMSKLQVHSYMYATVLIYLLVRVSRVQYFVMNVQYVVWDWLEVEQSSSTSTLLLKPQLAPSPCVDLCQLYVLRSHLHSVPVSAPASGAYTYCNRRYVLCAHVLLSAAPRCFYISILLLTRCLSRSQESPPTAARVKATAAAAARRPTPRRLPRQRLAAPRPTRAATATLTRTTLSSAARARRRTSSSTSDARSSPTGACAAWRSSQSSPN